MGGRKSPFPITLAIGLYNSLYYRTSRDVENVSEAAARIMREHNVPVQMKPYKTLESVLVGLHLGDRQEKVDLQNVCTKFLVPVVTRPTSAKLAGSLESDYRNTGLKWNPK